MTIPFTKAHGAKNDFLLTWRQSLPVDITDLREAAIAICERHTGVGADGWMIVSRNKSAVDSLAIVELVMAAEDADEAGVAENVQTAIQRFADGIANEEDSPNASIELWNSDGSRSEISGNGTRCAAALLVDAGLATNDIRILTGAGVKHLRLLERNGNAFSFEMNMGAAVIEDPNATIEDRPCVVLNVGNPQCAFFVDDFNFDWVGLGARLQRHPRFPNRTNVSFIRVIDRHTLDVRFFERGAGETMSSGTGSTGAGAAALAKGLVESPVRVLTQAGPLELRWRDTDIFLAGPAELAARGEFLWSRS